MVRVGLVQFDILWENASGNIEKLRQMLAGKENDLDLLILPELWTCGFTMNHDAHKTFEAGHQFMQEIANSHSCTVLGGLPHKTATGQENRCYLVTNDDSKAYAKMKAFKFAGEHKKYEQGTQTYRWDVAGFSLSPFICYDLRFPELPRAMVPESNLFTYVANWPAAREHHWRSLLMARAIENLSYVIGVNRIGTDGAGLTYPGASMVISPAGEILLDAGTEEGLFITEIEPAYVADIRQRWPFLEDK